jgi:hypothetical protein
MRARTTHKTYRSKEFFQRRHKVELERREFLRIKRHYKSERNTSRCALKRQYVIEFGDNLI